MEPISETVDVPASVLASFLMPHVLLDLPAADDTAEVHLAKARRNRAWLRRWLPTYIGRWALIFLALLTTTNATVEMGFPLILNWTLEFAEYASAGIALWLVYLYYLSALAKKG
jgi:hypothetical protein